jgi:hypothetical protein
MSARTAPLTLAGSERGGDCVVHLLRADKRILCRGQRRQGLHRRRVVALMAARGEGLGWGGVRVLQALNALRTYLRPTSQSAAPMKHTISVALGSRDTTRIVEQLMAVLMVVRPEGETADDCGELTILCV